MEEQNKFNSSIHEEVAVLRSRVENWMETTNDYRKTLCIKIDAINEKLVKLPCDTGKARYDNLNLQVKAVWASVVLVLGAIVAEWVKK